MPSIADLIFVALLGVFVFTPLSIRLFGDAGIGWHIRTGQQMLASHSIPHTDLFSSTMAGKSWFAWEWLYDLFVGKLAATLGLNGVVWLTAVVIAAVFAGTFRYLTSRGADIFVGLLLLLLAVSASSIHFLARPHVFSWLLTLIWFWILDSSERDGTASKKKLWILPFLMLLWANLHGGFLIGFALLGIFWLDALWNWGQANENRIEDMLAKVASRRRAWQLFYVGLACGAATFVNPFGWKLHSHIYAYLTNRFLMDHIDEFQSPNFHAIAPRCFLLLVLIALATFALQGRHLRMSDALTSMFAIYSGLYASRNIPVSSVLLVMIVAPLIPTSLRAGGFFRRMSTVEAGLRGHVWPILAVAATFLVVANGGHVGSNLAMDAHFGETRMPVAAVDYMQQHDVRGPVLTPDYWGGYVIYKLYPRDQVVVDDRHDLYGEQFFKSYLKFIRAQPGWETFLHEHAAGSILLPRDGAVAAALGNTEGWKTIYSDNLSIIYVPTSDSTR